MKILKNPLILIVAFTMLYFLLYGFRLFFIAAYNIPMDLLVDSLILGIVVLIEYFFMKIYFKENIIKLSIENILFFIIIGIIIAVVLTLLDVFVLSPFNEKVFSNIEYARRLYDMNYTIIKSIPDYISAFLFMTFVGPIFEEIYFRGFCYTLLRKKYSRNTSIIAVAIIFLIFHPVPQLLLIGLISSYILCLFYELSNNLAASILIHSFYNIIGFLQNYPL